MTQKPKLSSYFYFASIILIVIAIYIPALLSGFFQDDYILLTLMKSHASWQSVFSLYAFLPHQEVSKLVAQGLLPWWTDPNFSLVFLRPLSSALLYLQHSVFHETALGYHIVNLSLFLGAIVAFYKILARHLHGSLLILSIAIFAISNVFFMPVFWIANQHALVSLLLSLISLYLFTKPSSLRSNCFAFIAFALALLASELSLCISVYLFFYVAIIDRTRIKKFIPYLLIIIAYLVIYKAGGFGAHHSGFYISPLQAPQQYFNNLVINYPKSIIMSIFGQPLQGILTASSNTFYLYLLFIFSVLLIYRSIPSKPATTNKVLLWLLLSSLVAALISGTSVLQARTLLFSTIGFSVLLAQLLITLYRKSHGPSLLPVRVSFGFIFILFFIRALIIPPVITVFGSFYLNKQNQRVQAQLIMLKDRYKQCKYLVLPQASPLLSPFYAAAMSKILNLNKYPHIYSLDIGNSPYICKAISLNEYKLSLKQGGLLASPFSRLFHNTTPPITRQNLIPNKLITVEHLNSTPLGPTQIIFKLKNAGTCILS